MPRIAPLLAASLLVAACEDGTPEQNVTQVKAGNDYSNQMRAMPPMYRNLSLWRAVRDAPQRCKKVDNGAYQQEYRNLAMWTAHCSDSGDWAVFIAPNGDVQVRACQDTVSLRLPPCKPLPPPTEKTGDGGKGA
jgi:hypothetical protein